MTSLDTYSLKLTYKDPVGVFFFFAMRSTGDNYPEYLVFNSPYI